MQLQIKRRLCAEVRTNRISAHYCAFDDLIKGDRNDKKWKMQLFLYAFMMISRGN